MRKYLVEFIGTFFLVLVIGMVVLGGIGNFASLGIGATLMVMIYAGGHISGAHYNPAVTLAVLIRGKASIHEAIGYWVVQLVAAAIAGMVVLTFKGGAPLTVPQMNVLQVVAIELIITFALAFVVLNV